MVIGQKGSLAMLPSLRDEIQFERLKTWHVLGNLGSPDRQDFAIVVVVCQFRGRLVGCLTTEVASNIVRPSLDDMYGLRLNRLAYHAFEVTSLSFTHVGRMSPCYAGKRCTKVYGHNDIFLWLRHG
jgi:hypothetical protein